MEQTDEPVELVERVAALDLGKAGLVACVRVPHGPVGPSVEGRPGRRRAGGGQGTIDVWVILIGVALVRRR